METASIVEIGMQMTDAIVKGLLFIAVVLSGWVCQLIVAMMYPRLPPTFFIKLYIVYSILCAYFFCVSFPFLETMLIMVSTQLCMFPIVKYAKRI